jgi:hypothetical protein
VEPRVKLEKEAKLVQEVNRVQLDLEEKEVLRDPLEELVSVVNKVILVKED